MKRERILPISAILLFVVLGSCTDQFDPSYERAMFEEERKTANRTLPSLTEKGELPSGQAAAWDVKEVYARVCSTCHGMTGKADTQSAKFLNPPPRNFTDKSWQASVNDDHIKKVFLQGGASVGLSPSMAPFPGEFKKAGQAEAMVAYIRAFGK